jgi:hypothetical protein
MGVKSQNSLCSLLGNSPLTLSKREKEREGERQRGREINMH